MKVVSDYLPGLVPWQYDVSGGFTLRGYFTPPSGKPVIHFLHGNGFNGLVYEKFLAPLAEHFDLFLSNAQGHGGSDAGTRPFTTWDDSAAYFSEAWQHYRALWSDVKSVGLGHSFGGVNTLLMSGNDAALFDQIIMLDPIIGTKAWTYMANSLGTLGLSKYLPMVKQAKARGTYWESEAQAWDYFYERGTFKGWDEDCLRSYLRHALQKDEQGRLTLKCPPHIEAGIFGSYTSSIWSSLNKHRAPIDILYGDRTYDFVRKNLPKLASDYHHLNVHEVDGGHCFMFERPKSSAQQVLQVLSAS